MTNEELNEIENYFKSTGYYSNEYGERLVSEIRRLKRGPDKDDIREAAEEYTEKMMNINPYEATNAESDFMMGVRWRDAWNESTKENER